MHNVHVCVAWYSLEMLNSTIPSVFPVSGFLKLHLYIPVSVLSAKTIHIVHLTLIEVNNIICRQ